MAGYKNNDKVLNYILSSAFNISMLVILNLPGQVMNIHSICLQHTISEGRKIHRERRIMLSKWLFTMIRMASLGKIYKALTESSKTKFEFKFWE